jgi:hypothetical protein
MDMAVNSATERDLDLAACPASVYGYTFRK